MKSRLRTWPRLVTGLGACLFALGLVACNEDQPPASDSKAELFPDQILSDFQVEMTRGGLKSADIAADKGVIYRKRDSMIIQGLIAHLFDSEGVHSSTLRSDSGLLRERRQLMVAYGDVEMTSRDSLHLTSDTLYWYGELTGEAVQPSGRARPDSGADSASSRFMVAHGSVHLVTRDTVHLYTDTLLWNDINRRVATDAFVTIVRHGEDTLRGYGLRSDDQLQRITIQRQVSGRIREQ